MEFSYLHQKNPQKSRTKNKTKKNNPKQTKKQPKNNKHTATNPEVYIIIIVNILLHV